MPDAPTRMTAERLEELRRMAAHPVGAPNSTVRALLSDHRELIAEIDALASLLDLSTAEKFNAASTCLGMYVMHRELSADNAALHTDCRVMADALSGGGFGVRWTSGDDPEAVKAAIARHGSSTP